MDNVSQFVTLDKEAQRDRVGQVGGRLLGRVEDGLRLVLEPYVLPSRHNQQQVTAQPELFDRFLVSGAPNVTFPRRGTA